MHHFNKHPSFDVTFYGHHLSPPGHKPRAIENAQQPTYHGMTVQALNDPFHVLHNQSGIDNHDSDPCNLLDRYNISLLIHANQETDIPDLPQSLLDEFIPYHSGTEPFDNTLSSIPDPCFTQQDDWITDLPAIPPDPQNQNQIPQAEEIVVGKTAASENQKKRYQNNPDFAERQKARMRNRYQNDPDYAERQKARQRKRYQNDRDFSERHKMQQRERYKNDPDYSKRINERRRERKRKNPAYLDIQRMHLRELRKDPAYVERRKRLQRERIKKRRKNPAYIEHHRNYMREYRRKRRNALPKDPAQAGHNA